MKKDFLAIILIASGSSHARGPDLEDCVTRVQRIFVSDWSCLFDVKGKPAKVGLYDVTGHDDVYWDDWGVWASDHTGSDRKKIQLMEVREVVLPA